MLKDYHKTAYPQISLVVPCYNELQILPTLKSRLFEVLNKLDLDWEIIFVDDGSSDGTFDYLKYLHKEDPRFKSLSLSRNFGQQPALFAGLSLAKGEFVGIIDADLQDPPELFEKCLEKINGDYDVVYAIRTKRKENFVKKIMYSSFYRILRAISEIKIPLDSGDFCLMRQNVVEAVNQARGNSLFLRGARAWVGFKQIGIPYERDARHAGKSKYTFFKLLKLAVDGLSDFSTIPLKTISTVCIFFMALDIFSVFLLKNYFNVILFISIIFQFLFMAIFSIYLNKIYISNKKRPAWIIREKVGI